MAEDALLAALDEDAKAQAESIIHGAQIEADGLIKSAGEEASAIRDEMLSQAARSLERLRAGMMNNAAVKAASTLIDCRRALIDDVFERSLAAFSSIERAEYGLILNYWYDELWAAWEKAEIEGAPVVHANPADVALIAGRGSSLTPDPSVRLGLVFVSADGRVRLENTFQARMDKAKEDLVPLLNCILFSDDSHLNAGSKEP